MGVISHAAWWTKALIPAVVLFLLVLLSVVEQHVERRDYFVERSSFVPRESVECPQSPVIFILFTTARRAENVLRMNQMLESWMPKAPNGSIVIITDGYADYHSDTSRYRLLILDDDGTGKHMQKKVPRAFREVFELFQHCVNEKTWFFKIDDDTFVVLDQLFHLVGNLSTRDPVIAGHKRFKSGQYNCNGGAGYLMNKPILEVLVPTYEDCQDKYCRIPNEDECTATCALRLANATCTDLPGFYQYFIDFETQTKHFADARELARTVTVHQTKTPQRAKILKGLFYDDNDDTFLI